MGADRPARATVRAVVRAALADLEPGDRVLVALSGGPDSLALLAATVRVADERGLVCAAVVVDHGLQEDSARVAQRAADQARILGCGQVSVVGVHVPRGPGAGGLEAAARAARYSALRGAAEEVLPAAAVLLGHTRDDQAETVLLGLARGSGTRSLAGMAPVSGLLRRPLLDLAREVVGRAAAEAALEDPRLQPWVDPHNADAAHARVRVRSEVLPALEAALGPGIVEALARTARLARDDADALDGWADRVWVAGVQPVLGGAGVGGGLVGGVAASVGVPAGTGAGSPPSRQSGNEVAREGPFDPMVLGGGRDGEPVEEPLAEPFEELLAVPVVVLTTDGAGPLPVAVTSRLVRRLLAVAGCPEGALTAEHVWRVVGLLDGAPGRAEVALPGNLRARRVRGTLVVRA